MSHLVQVNIRLPAKSAERLKRLADQAGLKVPAFIARLIDQYDPASMTAPDRLTARIDAIESRLDSDTTIKLIDSLTAQIDSLTAKVDDMTSTPTGLTPVGDLIADLKQAGYDAQAIADELNNRGYSTNRGTAYSRSYISKILRTV